FRWLRVTNLAESQRNLDAYVKVAPRRDTFHQLASLMNRNTDLPRLSVLVWLHGWVEPTDPALWLWRGDLYFRTEKYDLAVAELRIYRSIKKETAGFEWHARDQIARSLLRLNRLAEARAELQSPDAKDSP